MAFVSNSPDLEEDKTNPPSSGQGSISPTGGGGGAVRLAPSSAVPAGGGSSGSGATAAGGQFASLDKYLAANQGQAEPLAGKVLAPIQNQYTSLDTQNKNTLSGIQGDVTKGYTASNPDVLAQEAANPTSFAGDAGNVSSFQKQLNDMYTGPLTAEGTDKYQTQQNAVNSAISQGQAQTGSDAGRKQLLTNVEATPTTGVTALNSAILSENPNYLNQVEKAYDPFQNLLGGLSTGAQDINTKIAGATTEAQNASQAANKAIADQVQGLNTTVGGETQAAQGNIDQYNKTVGTLQGAASGYQKDISDFLAANPNLTPTTNADLSAWANLTPFSGPPPTTATAATAKDYALANALQTLNGTAPTGMVLNPAQSTQAGTALPPTYQTILDALSNGTIPAAMTNQVKGYGTQITNAYQPVATAQANVDNYNALRAQLEPLQQQFQLLQSKQTAGSPLTDAQKAQMTDLQSQIATINQNPLIAQAPSEPQVGQIAQGVSWLPKTATAYNSLLTKLQADLAPVQGINIPTPPPSSSDNTLNNLKSAGLTSGVGTIPTLGAMVGNELYKAEGGTPETVGERAALFFPTLGTSLFLPQSTIDSIGKGISGAVSSIGDFFSGLF